MKTQAEIVAKMLAPRDSLIDFASDVLLSCLDFDHAKGWLKPEVTQEEWEEKRSKTDEDILAAMRSYAEFAWEKAQGHRGLSANRSVDKLETWTWLLGRDDVLKASEKAGWAQYGCPKLSVMCRAFGFPIPSDEPTQRMIRGEPCTQGCGDGCGQSE